MRQGYEQKQTVLHTQRRAVRVRRRTRTAALAGRGKTHADLIRDRRWRILLLLTMLFGLELAAASLTSPLLGISRIEVRNTENLLSSEVSATTRTVALPAGYNLLRAPLDQMERGLRALPWVQSATIRRHFPHGLRVQITPREPAVVAQIGAQRFELDANSIPIRPARPETAGRLPLIVIDRDFKPQYGVAIQDEALQAAISIYHNAHEQTLLHIAKIEVDQNGNICLNMKDTVQIEIGQTDDLTKKIDSVQRIYKEDPDIARRMVAINLSYPNQPACTPRNPAPTASGMQADSDNTPVKPTL